MLRTVPDFIFSLSFMSARLQFFVPRDENSAYGRSLDHDEGDHFALRRILHIDHHVAEKTGFVNVLEVFPDLRGIVDPALFGLRGVGHDPLVDPLVADDLDLRDLVGFRRVEKFQEMQQKIRRKARFLIQIGKLTDKRKIVKVKRNLLFPICMLTKNAEQKEAVMTDRRASATPVRVVFGFIAGFFGTIIFHQLALSLLWAAGVAPMRPFAMAATQPFGAPALISLAFWGGIWGIVFALADASFPAGWVYWVAAFLFGAILPSLVALLVVLPLKGRPMGGGWSPSLLVTAFLINGCWGLGTGIFLRAFRLRMRATGHGPEAGERA